MARLPNFRLRTVFAISVILVIYFGYPAMQRLAPVAAQWFVAALLMLAALIGTGGKWR